MPFQSEKQRRFLHANHPEIAKRWESDYANGGISNHFRRKYFSGAYGQGAGDRGGDPHASRAENVASSFTSVGKGGNNNNNTPPTHPIHTGPTVAELAARKAAAEAKAAAKAKAEAEAKHKEWITRKDKKKKKVNWFNKNLEDLKALSTVPLNMVKGAFGNPFNPDELTTATLTDPMKEDLISKAKAKGTSTGNIDFTDYNTPTKTFSGLNKFMDPIDIANALTMGGTNFTTDELGNIELTGDKYDFNKSSNPVLGFIDQGGLMGTSKKLGEKIYDWTHEAAKGGIARKNYFHGGILDINESEEIISDDGNDIELTDYNAAFDGPTGVKSLFRAKDGGTPQLAQKSKSGKRPGYAGNPFGYSDTPAHHGDVAHGDQGRFNQPSAPVQTQTVTAPKDGPTIPRGGGADFGTIPDEKGNVNLDLVDRVENEQRETEMLNLIRRNQLENPGREDKLRTYTQRMNDIQDEIKEKWRKKIDPTFFEEIRSLPSLNFLSIAMTVIKDIFDVREMKKDMEMLASLGLDKGHPMGTDTSFSNLQDYFAKRKLRKDDEGLGPDDMPKPIYDPTTGAVSEEYAQAQGQYGYPNSNLDQIRAGQAKYADYMEKIEREKAMFANSGGLANLFRVKNQ